MREEGCISAVSIILPVISERLKLNDLLFSASCHCWSEIQCYKTSHDSRRPGGEKQLFSLWLMLIVGGQAGSSCFFVFKFLMSVLIEAHTVPPLYRRIPTTKTRLENGGRSKFTH